MDRCFVSECSRKEYGVSAKALWFLSRKLEGVPVCFCELGFFGGDEFDKRARLITCPI